jgi:hypothetical protein
MSKKVKLEEIKIQSFITSLGSERMTKLKGGTGSTEGTDCTLETCVGTPCRPPDYTYWTTPCKCTNDPHNCPW